MSSGSTMRADNSPTFAIHSLNSAPEGSRDALKRLESAVGAIPNLAATMAGSPALIQGFVGLREINNTASGLNAQERELLFLVNASANECNYCRTIHSIFASKTGLADETIEAVKHEKPLEDSRLNALVAFGRSVVKNRARLDPTEVERFLEAGFQKGHVLDVVACLAQSIMANYTGHITHVEFDEFLKPQN